jgi:hypothetical protein
MRLVSTWAKPLKLTTLMLALAPAPWRQRHIGVDETGILQ